MSEELTLSYRSVRTRPDLPSHFAIVESYQPGEPGRPAVMMALVNKQSIKITQATADKAVKYTVDSISVPGSETYIRPGSIIRLDNIFKISDNHWQTSFIKRVSNGPDDRENGAVRLTARPLPPSRGSTRGSLDIITTKHSQKATDLQTFDAMLKTYATSRDFPFIKAGIVGTRCIFISERADTRCHRIFIPQAKDLDAKGVVSYREMTSAELSSHLANNPTVSAIRAALAKGKGKGITVSPGFSAVVPSGVAESPAYARVIEKCSAKFNTRDGADNVVIEQIGFKTLNVALFNGFCSSINTSDFKPPLLNANVDSTPVPQPDKTATKASAQDAAKKAGNALAQAQQRHESTTVAVVAPAEPAAQKFIQHVADDAHLSGDYGHWSGERDGEHSQDYLSEYDSLQNANENEAGRHADLPTTLRYGDLEDTPYQPATNSSSPSGDASALDDKSDEELLQDDSLDALFAHQPTKAMSPS